MKICLDTRNTGRSGGTGIATYTRNVAAASLRAGHEVAWLEDGEDNLASPHSPGAKLQRQLRALSASRLARTHGTRTHESSWLCPDLYRVAHVRFRQTGRLTRIRSVETPDLVHWTTPLPLEWAETPGVVTIHDLIPILHPELTGIAPIHFGRMLRQCCAKARLIITVSEAVRRDVLAFDDLPPEKVVTLHQPVDLSAYPVENMQAAPALVEPGGFVFFGALERRKNLVRLVRAWAASDTGRTLTLIGQPGLGADALFAELDRLGEKRDRIRIVPWSGRDSLLRTIDEARAVVFPSLAEGFGLPIIEAMALGTPVLTSIGHATEEIAGGAALLVDPHSTDSIQAGLEALAEDDALCGKLTQNGLVRADAFSPGRFSAGLDAAYKLAL